jgi:putative endonuclease
MTRGPERRRAARRRGLRAELVAGLWLRLKGYRILARSLRTPVGEIDIVARRGQVLAIVEVKARASLEEAAAALAPRQRRRLSRAAEVLLQRHPVLRELALRFDVLLIAPGRRPRHILDAWRADLDGSSYKD